MQKRAELVGGLLVLGICPYALSGHGRRHASKWTVRGAYTWGRATQDIAQTTAEASTEKTSALDAPTYCA
eukprot:2159877-Lingulodinium_polyedra.AAC.1